MVTFLHTLKRYISESLIPNLKKECGARTNISARSTNLARLPRIRKVVLGSGRTLTQLYSEAFLQIFRKRTSDVIIFWRRRILQQPNPNLFSLNAALETQQWCRFRAPRAPFGPPPPEETSSPSSEPRATHFRLLMYEESGCLDDELKSLFLVFALFIFR